MNTIEYTVTGMTCSNCEQHVREEVEEIPGLSVAEVSAATGILRVTADGPIDNEKVLAAVEEAGYTAVAA